MFSRRYVITCAALISLLPLGGNAFAEEKPLPVIASFSILGNLVRNVGGDHVDVTTLVGPDGDAHVYSPTPADAKAVSAARLVFVNGLGFEGWMERLVEASGSKAPLITVSKGVTAIGSAEEGEAGDKHEGHAEEGHDHHHGDSDPHAFQSVANGKIYVGNIRDALIAADPAHREDYDANAMAYLAKLDEVEGEIRVAVAAIPEANRTIVTSHDAFGYFAAAYGLTFVAPQGISTEAEPSAKEVSILIRQIRDQKAKAVFVENISDERMVRRIGDESGARIGGELYSDALSPKDGPAGTYIDMFRHNITTLKAALAP